MSEVKVQFKLENESHEIWLKDADQITVKKFLDIVGDNLSPLYPVLMMEKMLDEREIYYNRYSSCRLVDIVREGGKIVVSKVYDLCEEYIPQFGKPPVSVETIIINNPKVMTYPFHNILYVPGIFLPNRAVDLKTFQNIVALCKICKTDHRFLDFLELNDSIEAKVILYLSENNKDIRLYLLEDILEHANVEILSMLEDNAINDIKHLLRTRLKVSKKISQTMEYLRDRYDVKFNRIIGFSFRFFSYYIFPHPIIKGLTEEACGDDAFKMLSGIKNYEEMLSVLTYVHQKLTNEQIVSILASQESKMSEKQSIFVRSYNRTNIFDEKRSLIDYYSPYFSEKMFKQYKPTISEDRCHKFIAESPSVSALQEIYDKFPDKRDKMKKLLLSEPRESLMSVISERDPNFIENVIGDETLLLKLPVMNKATMLRWYLTVSRGIFISPDVLLNTNIDQSHYESLKLLTEKGLVTRLMLTEFIKNA